MVQEVNEITAATLGAEGNRLGQKTVNTILVVEDVPEIALHMKRRLIERGHKVIWAQEPEDAIEIAEQILPSVILTDLDLPKLDLLMELVTNHRDLSELPVAVIDINHPELSDSRVKVLPDFDALESLVRPL